MIPMTRAPMEIAKLSDNPLNTIEIRKNAHGINTPQVTLRNFGFHLNPY